jgi:hypothetical protein
VALSSGSELRAAAYSSSARAGRADLANQDPGIEDERARQRVSVCPGCRKGRLVIQPEIAAKPDET